MLYIQYIFNTIQTTRKYLNKSKLVKSFGQASSIKID